VTVLESSSSRPAGRETWGGHGVVARVQPIRVHQADECGTRHKVENFIASTIISMSEQISIIHVIESFGVISRQTQGYVLQTNSWARMFVMKYLHGVESCVRS